MQRMIDVSRKLMDPRKHRDFAKYRVRDAVERFVRECELENRSQATVIWYRKRLGQTLAPFMDEDISVLHQETLEQIRFDVLGRHTPQTANGHIASLKRFAYWLLDNGFLKEIQPRRLRLAKVDQKLPTTLTDGEATRLLEALQKDDIYSRRDLTVTALMLDTGLRVGEALSVKLAELDSLSGIINIRNTKGRRDRTVKMSPNMMLLMTDWLSIRTRMPDRVGEYVFPSRESDMLSARQYNINLKKHAAAAGIEKRVTAHVLRFTYATSCLNAGMDAASLQHALGHAHIAMSMHYARMYDVTSHRDSVQASPLNRVMPQSRRRGGMRGVKRHPTQ